VDNRRPPILAICGIKNSGKTTCLEQLVAEFACLGLRVAVIKHDGHEFQGDVPGTDSWRMYQAGAFGTAVCSGTQVLIHKRQEGSLETEKQLEQAAESFFEADLILVEGMKGLPIPKLEIIREGISKIPVSNPKGRIGILTDITTDREEFARATGYEPGEAERLYLLGRPKELAQELRNIFLIQGG
jgi:molybdopterin-guanine dinucleotide biosynthesis protein B